MYILLFVLSLLAVFEDVVFCNKEDFDAIDNIEQEEPCSRVGGMCVIASDCPSGHLAQENGLCPTQQSDGVECCYGKSVKDTRCKRMGKCRSASELCNRLLVIPATDCPVGTRCCVLVN